MYDDSNNLIDYVFYKKLNTENNSCIHSGDDRYGKNKDGDNEVISINLKKLDTRIKHIWPVINVYSGFSSFKDVSGAYCRILDN